MAAETAKAVPITITSGMFNDCPILVIIGIKIKDATVCEMKVATDPEKNKMKMKASHGLDNGNAVQKW